MKVVAVNSKEVDSRNYLIGQVLGTIRIVVIVLGILILAYGVTKFIDKNNLLKSYVESGHSIDLDDVTVRNELMEIGELMTYSSVYDGTANEEDYRTFFDSNIKIPFTSHKIALVYSGIIKAGYNIEDIKIDVDNVWKKINITLPDNIIVDNNLPVESVQTIDENNILNPIRGDEVCNLLSEIKDKKLREAEDNGLYEKAQNHAKEIIENSLSGFEGYKVVFK